jgi:DNA-binding NarL/FixJ family response regulator
VLRFERLIPAARSHSRRAVIGVAGVRSQKSVRIGMRSVEVLIVDDQARFRRLLRSLIESQPEYRVCGEASDGMEAIQKVDQLHPDLVLMDINMPRMNGLEATRIIRRESPDCNVVIVSQNDARVARD